MKLEGGAKGRKLSSKGGLFPEKNSCINILSEEELAKKLITSNYSKQHVGPNFTDKFFVNN